MPSYAAFIGHQPHLSMAELSASLPDFRIERILGGAVVIFSAGEILDEAFLRRLGGTIVIAKAFESAPTDWSTLPRLLVHETQTVKGKVTYSLRTHGLPPSTVSKLYRECKNALKKSGRPARYVGSEGKPAPSLVLHKEGLIGGKHGCEFVIASGKEFLWMGKTVAAQDIEAYAKRDVRKPVRDTSVGLLPPKLAQILLNFGVWLVKGQQSQNRNSQFVIRNSLTVWDPFCGTGVIPMECLLRGWTALASDLSLKAVNGCTKNLDWLRKEEKIFKKDVESAVWKQDARKPFESKKKPDVIVTETNLGPALTGRPSQKSTATMRAENERLQEEFLRAVAQTLPGVPLVVTWPVWYNRKEQVRLEHVWSVVDELGYRSTLPPGIESDRENRLSLLYRRPDQFVGREIVLLQARRR
ncbi:hypothetical protein HY285_00700 [Candidatus Peregrinibacteria bacterium]|nr:hypothetical protein [Candidatus Peregrinibacteria bacterium]MBI3816049.1 hypothetical protein [Candidatus Peregrinibacteria bacterium]